jgi:hypothetical protein
MLKLQTLRHVAIIEYIQGILKAGVSVRIPINNTLKARCDDIWKRCSGMVIVHGLNPLMNVYPFMGIRTRWLNDHVRLRRPLPCYDYWVTVTAVTLPLREVTATTPPSDEFSGPTSVEALQVQDDRGRGCGG